MTAQLFSKGMSLGDDHESSPNLVTVEPHLLATLHERPGFHCTSKPKSQTIKIIHNIIGVWAATHESEQPMVRSIVNVTDCLLKCLVYRGGGKEGQFIKVNYHIQSSHGIMIIGPTR